SACCAHRIRMHPEGLANTGSEPVCLYEQCDQISHLFQIGTMGKISQGLLSRDTASQFKRQKVHFVTQFRMSPLDFFSDPGNGLIQAQACFHTNHHQIQSIRNCPLECVLPLCNGSSEPEHWSIIATCGGQHIEKCQF